MLAGTKSCPADALYVYNNNRGVSEKGCPALFFRDSAILALFLSKLLNRDDGN